MKQIYKENGDTWPKILKYNNGKYGDSRIAMRHKQRGIWRAYTWKNYYLNVKYLALGLLSLGFEQGDKVLIIGDNAPEWYYSELAVQANHGASVGLYSDLNPLEIKYIAENSEARFAIVADQEQVDKFLQIKDELPLIKKIIYWNYKGLAHYDDPILTEYQELLRLGEEYEAEHRELFEHNVETGKTDDVCAIIYTSGTCGTVPNGAIHTYRTVMANAEYHLHLDPWYENDNIVPYLPPAWMTEQWFAVGCHLLSASILNFAEETETQQQDSREIGPTVVIWGARIWDRQAATVRAQILNADAINRFIFNWLMPFGYKIAELKNRKQKLSLFQKVLYPLADVALFRPIKDSLGLSKARICYSTGAILSAEALKFYHALNLPLKNIYGSTEGGALTGAKTNDIQLETVGPVHKGTEVRITTDGEIILRHTGVFSGYYRNPEKTAEVLKNGWFHSGDSGFINEDGHLVFLERLKDLTELPGGDKLAPQFIECQLRFSPYIKDTWILAGPNKAYTSAVIIIDYNSVGRWAGQRRIAYTNFTELSQKSEVYQLIEDEIQKINQALSPGIRIKKYVNLHKEFDPDEAELTRSRKLRRTFLEEHYHELIDAIYSDQTAVPIQTQVKYRDGRTGTAKTTIRIKSIEGDVQ